MEKSMSQKEEITHAIAYVPVGHVHEKVLLCDQSRNIRTILGTNEFWTEDGSNLSVTCPECKKYLKKIPMPISSQQLDGNKLLILLKLLQTSRDAIYDDQGEYAYIRGDGVEALHRAIDMLEAKDEQTKG